MQLLVASKRDDTPGEAAGVVDDRAPQGPRLPPPAIGRVVAEGDDEGDGAAEKRQRQVWQRHEAPVEAAIGDGDGDIVGDQNRQDRQVEPCEEAEMKSLVDDHRSLCTALPEREQIAARKGDEDLALCRDGRSGRRGG